MYVESGIYQHADDQIREAETIMSLENTGLQMG